MDILIAWLGNNDIKASSSAPDNSPLEKGPIASTLMERHFDLLWLICNRDPAISERYSDWLSKSPLLTQPTVKVTNVQLDSPTDHSKIYELAFSTIKTIQSEFPDASLTFHLSPGTPAMHAVWILLQKSQFSARLIESSTEAGVKDVEIPFELAVERISTLTGLSDRSLSRLINDLPDVRNAFSDIIYQCDEMQKCVEIAYRAALSGLPILITGESGTGKELFAKAIRNASNRSGSNHPYIPVNCGAIAPTIVDSELFGHEKGSFTGAIQARKGKFEEAHKGTIFLDEVGELPLDIQVRLLRVLQERYVTRLGSSKEVPIDVRVISATNRNLENEIKEGRFREDLFYRLSVVPIHLPPLRERRGDLMLLIDKMWTNIVNELSVHTPISEKLKPSTKKLLLQHPWPGNVRQLINTLYRIAVLGLEEKGAEAQLVNLIGNAQSTTKDNILNRQIGENFSIKALLSEVESHYIHRALRECNGNKAKASKLLGLRSGQTFTDKLKRLT